MMPDEAEVFLPKKSTHARPMDFMHRNRASLEDALARERAVEVVHSRRMVKVLLVWQEVEEERVVRFTRERIVTEGGNK